MRTIYFIVITILLLGCKEKTEGPPSYIRINDIGFEYKNVDIVGNGGTAITDAWVYDNSNLLGVFELPATIAVNSLGNRDISVRAGIKLNGISSTREPYTYYVRYQKNVNLTPLDTVVLDPEVSYFSETGISFKEDFQNIVLQLDTTPTSEVALQRLNVQNQPNYLDKYVGYVELNSANKGFKAYTKKLFNLPDPLTLPVYLEMDYQCNQDFVIGALLSRPGSGIEELPVITLRSTLKNDSLQWKHIYIDLTDYFTGQSDAVGFGLSVTAYYHSINSKGQIYFDNFKVVNQNQ